ncbi:glycosyltransferase family 2 protein [Hafnia alvei]|uniref:Glycosyltransferase, group 2 family protein n=1 Tax=Hafnia alvei ATCC 51873 TaxID=1002364 RepID=G9Y1I4_HAFAL|nr:glycosyltransferase family 2 protein [Hafnia alvei]EHM47919.1 glycosyltransferase, group 2 family protein [Hafnia alvei ATCC 51873]QQE44500.1 glycosyltransferase family 2 protein [Hafnia alvei]
MILLSIIIPVYNVGSYVTDCINSLLHNLDTGLNEKIEIIIVDDGSTDNSWCIIAEYAKLFPFIHCWRKNNGGLSDARNYGINKCAGKYLAFIDSDDIVSNYFISDVIRCIEKHDFDLLSFEYKKFVHKSPFETSVTPHKYPDISFVDKYFYNNKALFAWNKVYSKRMFDGLSFTEGLYYEDVALIPLLIDRAKVIAHMDFCYYGYRQRPGSITYCKDDKYLDILKAVKIIYNISNSKFIKTIVMNQFFTLTFITLRLPTPRTIKNLRRISDFYKENFKKEEFSPSLFNRHVFFYALSNHSKLYIPLALLFKPIVLIHLVLKKIKSTL